MITADEIVGHLEKEQSTNFPVGRANNVCGCVNTSKIVLKQSLQDYSDETSILSLFLPLFPFLLYLHMMIQSNGFKLLQYYHYCTAFSCRCSAMEKAKLEIYLLSGVKYAFNFNPQIGSKQKAVQSLHLTRKPPVECRMIVLMMKT